MERFFFYFKGKDTEGRADSFIGTIEAEHETQTKRIFERDYEPSEIEVFEVYCSCCLAKY